MHNLRFIQRRFGEKKGNRIIAWLALSMGLLLIIGLVLLLLLG